jgi:hypothetical protein
LSSLSTLVQSLANPACISNSNVTHPAGCPEVLYGGNTAITAGPTLLVGQTNITTPELRNDNDPTLVQVMVRAPEMAHETIRAMLADQSLSSDMILLGPRARYSN